MSHTVIKVQNLSKRYRIGLKEERHDTFTGQMMAMLKAPVRNFRQLRGLSKFKGEDESVFWALRDINFEVKQGEVLGIIGHNGAGKSTLLKILSHITEPTTGEVHLKGRVSALLEVGTGFHPELTGRENIYMNGTILGMTKKEIDRKLDEIVDFSGVEKHIDTPVKFYSSGMKVRLGFSVAAHLEPEILIIDEVLAVGDAEFQKKCLGKMEDVAQHGRTVLFVSHNMTAVRNLCQKGIILSKGKIQLIGNTEDAINCYVNENTESLTKIEYTFQEAPGNHEARFILGEIRPLFQKTWPIEEQDGFELEFVFMYLGKEETNLDITFHLVDDYGNLVFVGSSAFELTPINFNHGIIKAVCQIPEGIIHQGYYKISKLFLVRNRGVGILKILDPISFEISGKANAYLGWMGKKEGIVKPKLKWILNHDSSK